MKVYKHSTSVSFYPYMDNCYIGEKRDALDEDVTTIWALFEFYRVGQIDYIQFRNFCKMYLLPLWGTLPEKDKLELVKHNIAPSQADKDSFLSRDAQLNNYIEIVKRDVKAREARWTEAMTKVAFVLFNSPLIKLQLYLDAKEFRTDYIEADLPMLVLWLTSGSYPELGIDFTTTGFSSKSYYSEEVRDIAMSVFNK